MTQAVQRSIRRQARVATMAAALSAGAAAVSLSRGARRVAVTERPAADAGLVGLIERVADATSRAGTVDEALFACLAQLCRWTGWPVGHVYLVDPGDPGLLLPSRLWYLSDPAKFAGFREETERTPLHQGVGLPGRVLDGPHAEWIVDVGCDANFLRHASAAQVGLHGAFWFPIPIAGETFAVVECFSLNAVRPDDRLLEVVSHIGRQLGRLIAGMRTEQALRESESRFRSVAETANDAIIAADCEGRILSWNPAAERMFGFDGERVLGRPLSILMPERFRPMHDAGVARVAERPESSRIIGQTVEVVGLRADGAEFPIELSLSTWETGGVRYFGGIIRDIAARKHAEDQARVLETAPDPIVRVDAARRIVLANARTEQLFGYARSGLVGRSVDDLFAAHSSRRAADRFHAASADAGVADAAEQDVELTGRRKDGSEFPVDVTLRSVLGNDGAPVVTCILRDVTERRRFESQLRHLADHDHLTALFNRRRFEEVLLEYIGSGPDRRGAVLLLDLDRFKYVNDFHGHSAGDEVVRMIGRTLTDVVDGSDVVARLGGDEFAVLLKTADRDAAERAAHAILAAVRAQSLAIGTLSVSITTSVGVVPFDTADSRLESLLACADMAMYAAKEAGGNRCHVFDGNDEQVSEMQSRLAWADQIRRALDEDRFVLYWQPIIELRTGVATHHELLLRMVGEDGEIIPPGAFIETAERFDLIQEIDRWVIRAAIRLLAERAEQDADLLEVNLSGKSIGDPALPELIEQELIGANVDPSRLVFEITETAAIAKMEQAQAFAERLTRLGCRFALDDFGAGFSSFYYLKHLPLDYVKIDGDFIRLLTSSATDQLMVKSIVDIARGMGLQTIAEFVEDGATAALLRELGVDFSQGYHHGRPLPIPAAVPALPR
jgi:diguanylate cyclase (GGDEF)-like protein/PAS domain S-box-containing protein